MNTELETKYMRGVLPPRGKYIKLVPTGRYHEGVEVVEPVDVTVMVEALESAWTKRQESALAELAEIKRRFDALELSAQSKQEPVAFLKALEAAREWIGAAPHGDNCFLHDDGEYNRCFCGKDSIENYIDGVLENTTPPQRKPLTDEQIKAALWDAYKADLEAQGIDTQGMDFNQWYSPSHLFYAKAAIKAAHGIKGAA